MAPAPGCPIAQILEASTSLKAQQERYKRTRTPVELAELSRIILTIPLQAGLPRGFCDYTLRFSVAR